MKLFTDIPELCGCEDIIGYEKHIDNLVRLRLVDVPDECLTDKNKYVRLKNHPFIIKRKKELESLDVVEKVDYIEGYIHVTEFGNSFCSICLKVIEKNVE